MEMRYKEGQYAPVQIPINHENMEYRIKARDSKLIPYIGNPFRGIEGLKDVH